MSEHPILFNADMVRSILEGRKTQTRRPVVVPWKGGKRVPPYEPYYVEEDGRLFFEDEYGDFHPMEQRCPFGKPGDILWVRETWRVSGWDLDGESISVDFRSDGMIDKRLRDVCDSDQFTRLVEQSCDDAETAGVEQAGKTIDEEGFGDDPARYIWDSGNSPCRWRPSIHMPRWAARIFLRVKSVRVERLWSITEEDAKAEGVKHIPFSECDYIPDSEFCVVEGRTSVTNFETPIHRAGFFKEWESVYKNWDSNPWVWVVEFERVDETEVSNA